MTRKEHETLTRTIEQLDRWHEQLASRLQETADGLDMWYRNRNGAGAGLAGLHPSHAANRLRKMAREIAPYFKGNGRGNSQ